MIETILAGIGGVGAGISIAIIYIEKRYQKRIDDMLNRIMARDYSEYAAMRDDAAPPDSRGYTDEQEAVIEELEKKAENLHGKLSNPEVGA